MAFEALKIQDPNGATETPKTMDDISKKVLDTYTKAADLLTDRILEIAMKGAKKYPANSTWSLEGALPEEDPDTYNSMIQLFKVPTFSKKFKEALNLKNIQLICNNSDNVLKKLNELNDMRVKNPVYDNNIREEKQSTIQQRNDNFGDRDMK